MWLFTDRSRKDEIKSLTANDFTEFYGRVKGIKDFHRKHPNEVSCSCILFILSIQLFAVIPNKPSLYTVSGNKGATLFSTIPLASLSQLS